MHSIELLLISPEKIKLSFNQAITGTVTYNNKEYKLEDESEILINYNKSENYPKYLEIAKEDNNEKLNINSLCLNKLEETNKKERKSLSNLDYFFLCNNTINGDSPTIRKCNAAVILAYRSLEIFDEEFINHSFETTSRLLNEIFSSEIKTNNKRPKNNLPHVVISLLYTQILQAAFLKNEINFVDKINESLNFSRTFHDKGFLSSSYYSLVLIHRLIAIYIGRELSFLIYNESLNLSKVALQNYDESFGYVEVSELSLSLKKLSELNKFSNLSVTLPDDHDINFIHNSSRLHTRSDQLFFNINKVFKKNLRINLKSTFVENSLEVKAYEIYAKESIENEDFASQYKVFKKLLSINPLSIKYKKLYLKSCENLFKQTG